ncbi:hypothetical protein ASG76_12215 [Nocardioides sp. Soil774]|uniref:hypothetical protein n=1 Tax=Nocardioides sp. Soil774 TaxID=1736408 RepID=UPI0006F65B7A|nr:hypothetical protein [Nocardioides sp. Soil774]KRE94151.1 hypothetical protein ASG76_12215 [Nocardioides sp. Soil774]
MPDAPLTPEHDAVRRLLADARHTGPTPPEVVARLDEALATLVAEHVVEHGAGTPASEAAARVSPGARRRRVVGIGLLAAAAVVVAGVGVGQVLPRGADDGGSADSAGAGASAADSSAGSDTGLERSAKGSTGAEPGPESLRTYSAQSGGPSLTSGDPALAEQLVQLRSDGVMFQGGDPAAALSCAGPADAGGRRLTAEVDGRPGLVVFRRPAGDTQRVELYTCDSPDPVRTLTVPAP